MANEFSVKVDVSGVDIERFGRMTKKAIIKYMQGQCDELEAYMKKNAKWNDRTGNARRGLKADLEENDNYVKIELKHTVDYGVYLEYAMETRYSILEPTSRIRGPYVIRGLQNLINKRKFFSWM